MNAREPQVDLSILGQLRPVHPESVRSVIDRARAHAALRARARRQARRRALEASLQPFLIAAIPLVFLIALIRDLWRMN
jgi:hypothetical protein